jgi:hypothetical protein
MQKYIFFLILEKYFPESYQPPNTFFAKVHTRGISILGEVRNAEISRVTQQLICSKF